MPLCSVLPSPLCALAAQEPPQPLQQCLAVNAWSVVVFAAVAPLLVMYRLEHRSRTLFDERQQQRRLLRHAQQQEREQQQQGQREQREGAAAADATAEAAAASVGPSSLAAFSSSSRELEGLADLDLAPPVLPFAGHWLFDLYLCSSLVWSVAAAIPTDATSAH